MANRRKSLPPVSPRLDAELRPLVAAIAEIIETGEGVRGNPLDRKITLRDLLDSGIGQLKAGATAASSGGLESGVQPAPVDMSTPPTPTGFLVNGSWNGRITLSWTIPQSLYGNHAYTTIYRNAADNFANAVVVGREVGGVFTDFVRDDTVSPDDPTHLPGYYYWITFTSTADVEGPPNSPNGTFGQPLPDVGYILETLSSQLDDSPTTLGAEDETLILHAERFAIRVGPAANPVYPLIIQDVGGTPTVVIDTALIRNGSIQEGQLGAITIGKISENDGVTPITTVGGLIRADAIDADNLSVASAATFYGDVSSGNFVDGVSGWRILQSGTVQFNEGLFNGQVEFSNVTGANKPADNADVTGSNTSADTAAVNGRPAADVISDIDTALSDAANAQATADGKINSFYQTTAPTSGMDLGDLWFDTDDGNRLYRYNGTSWVAADDDRIGQALNDASTAQATADGKVTTFFGTSTPTAEGVGDLWYNSTTETLRRWNGSSWVDVSDITANKTANDTSNVAGTAAATVRDNAANGAASASTISDWTRPTTTLIDGNKIYTGDAYVDTLQIQGQAVTFPSGVYTAGKYDGNSNWTTCQTLSFTGTGAPLIINFGMFTTGVTGNHRVLVNGTVVWDIYNVAQGTLLAGTLYRTGVSGTNTIQLQCQNTGIDVYRRGITCIEAKR